MLSTWMRKSNTYDTFTKLKYPKGFLVKQKKKQKKS